RSLEDPNSQLGLAHYLEHMVLMGSKTLSRAGKPVRNFPTNEISQP
ncbi:insulinase family protein, partial [Serratia ureilytica]|nr:insulinase family protein [Serratia ureilytica]